MNRILASTLACAMIAIGGNLTLAGEVVKIDPSHNNQNGTINLDPNAKPAEKPDEKTPPVNQPKAIISEEAQKLIDQVSGAYGKLKSLELEGMMTGHFDVVGQQTGGDIPFTASFETPNKFRHSSKSNILIGSDGEKAYAYGFDDNIYVLGASPKEKVATRDLPVGFRDALNDQNLSLRLALAKNPGQELVDGAKTIVRADDSKVGEVICPTLKLTMHDGGVLTLAVDPDTHLLRHTNLDLRKKLEERNTPLVKEAYYEITYSKITPDAPVKAEQFAWTPPAGAKDIKEAKSVPAHEAFAADVLVGKPAPDFKLMDLEGNTVSLAQLKGQVVILDFWATWCPPCREALPHLDGFYHSKQGEGLKVFAIDLAEDKQKAQAFVEETKLGVPVLLDLDKEIGGKYKVKLIPQTVLIGKDGTVIKVTIGIEPAEMEELHTAAIEAMKK